MLLAGFVAFGVTAGAILLNSGVLLSEQALGGLPKSQAAGSSLAASSLNNALTDSLKIDEKTRLLLNAALVFLGLGAVLLGKPAPHDHCQMACDLFALVAYPSLYCARA